MLESVRGVCTRCGKEKFIQNSRGVCIECVFELNHGGKTRLQTYTERARKSVKHSETTGERVLFLEIWKEREHICENCKEILGEEPKVWMFAHIIGKGANKLLRLVKKNIRLLCYDCHYALDSRGKEEYEKRRK